jgi:hypothetical protein
MYCVDTLPLLHKMSVDPLFNLLKTEVPDIQKCTLIVITTTTTTTTTTKMGIGSSSQRANLGLHIQFALNARNVIAVFI